MFPPASAPEAAPEHTCPPRQVGAEVGMSRGPTSVGTAKRGFGGDGTWGPPGPARPEEALVGEVGSLLRQAPLLVPAEVGVSTWGRGLHWLPRPLHTPQQWHPASVVAWASSTSFPSCGAPYFCPFRQSLHSQHLSPLWVCSPNATCQHPAPLCTRRCPTQAGVSRAVAQTICVGLTLSRLPQTGRCTLL